MPEEKKTNTPQKPATDTAPEAPEAPVDVVSEVTSKINDSHNVLIALSSDPSVDEMSTAIGLSLYLDKLGKRTTAIYSGTTPNALEFLKPEETFEANVGSLQDFIVALNKEKADHLRYKLDGDFVKIYITPYHARIVKDDLEFSYGDYNVDLVLALNVANGIDLDSALREHGRIMHDATIINITTGNPGKLGEIEWSDKNASSVAEMISKLLYTMGSSTPMEKDEATAFLTGIVAATNRFSNAKTTPECMELASKLMESGANQQLISKNITPDVENKFFGLSRTNALYKEGDMPSDSADDPTKLDIEHTEEEEAEAKAEAKAEKTPVDPLLADLKAAEASLSQAGAETVPEAGDSPVDINNQDGLGTSTGPVGAVDPIEIAEPVASTNFTEPEEPEASPVEESSTESETEPAEEPMESAEESEPAEEPTESTESSEPSIEPSTTEPSEEAGSATESGYLERVQPEKVIQPSADLGASLAAGDETNKYGQMLEDALKSAGVSDAPMAGSNPAAMNAPAVPANPEINGVPSINYMPMPGDEVLPPPPTPPIAPMGSTAPMGSPITPITPAAPMTLPTPEPLGAQPSMQDQVYAPQVNDPGAFKIPGM